MPAQQRTGGCTHCCLAQYTISKPCAHVRSSPQVAQYNAATSLWHDIRSGLRRACLRTGAGRDVFKAFWAAQQRFFKLLCMSLKIPAVVQAARAALAEGHCVVVGLQSTGEAALDAMGCTPGEACGWVSTLRLMLRQLVAQHFPVTYQHEQDSGAPRCVVCACGKAGHVMAHCSTLAATWCHTVQRAHAQRRRRACRKTTLRV